MARCARPPIWIPVRNAAQDQEDDRARRASIEKWEAFCKPTRTYDDTGVVRLQYARRGCEFAAASDLDCAPRDPRGVRLKDR